MELAENSGAKTGSSGQNMENTKKANFKEEKPAAAINSNGNGNNYTEMQNGFNEKNQQQMVTKTAGPNELSNVENGGNGEIFKNEMSDLVEMLSKLNPMAEEFIPPSLANHRNLKDNRFSENGFGFSDKNFVVQVNSGSANGHTNGRKRNNNYSRRKRKMKIKTGIAEREDAIRNTVYVYDIDLQVTEELLAGLFQSCGPVVDCRICGDLISALRFAFVEFYNEEDARAALNLSGTILGFYPLRVLPSKTAIAPVNPTFLPRSENEREMSSRTIYCTNIDKKVTKANVKLFFESVCGEVQRLRLLGDSHHSTSSAFVEFTMAESAIAALNCSGAVLRSLPIRVAPSKTPVHPRALRPAMH